MPIYENVQTMTYYPNPESQARKLFEGLKFESILDVGTGHGGVFDLDFWERNPDVTKNKLVISNGLDRSQKDGT